MKARPVTRGERGITLVELLVALTLLGALSVLIMGGLRFGARSWERVEEASGAVNSTVRVHAFLRKQLSSRALPDSVAGEDDRLVFTALWLTALRGAGLYRFELWQQDDNLILSWAPASAAANSSFSGQRVLLENVEALAVQYYGEPPGFSAAEWLGRWAPEWPAPELVRVMLDLKGPDRSWPILTVALQG